MNRRRFLRAIPALASASALSTAEPGALAEEGGEKITLRMATLAPNGSSWMRVFNAWNNSLKEATRDRLSLRFYAGGAAGDERDAVLKMKAGQMDGAAVTTVGLGQMVRSVLVLQAPGVCNTYPRIDAVRQKLAGEFESAFDKAGFTLLGWGDAGLARIFSNRAVRTPADLRHARVWSWRDDPTWQSVLDASQVTGVSLGLPEVYPALRTNRIDTFPGTAIAAIAFQWHTQVKHITKDSQAVVIGATVIKKEKFEALPSDLKTPLMETSEQAHRALARTIRQDDQKAFDTIVERGAVAEDLTSEAAAWLPILKTARQSLAGKLFSAELLARVEQIAHEVE